MASKSDEMTHLDVTCEPQADSLWKVPRTMVTILAVLTGYLVILATMFSLLQPQGLPWTLAATATGLGTGTAAFLLFKRAGQKGFTKLFGKNEATPSERP